MNIPLIEKMIEAISKHPNNFYMADWVTRWASDKDGYEYQTSESDPNYCKTTACLAGWACFLGDESNSVDDELTANAISIDENGFYDEEAKRLLELSRAMMNTLFYSGNWPEYYDALRDKTDETTTALRLLTDLKDGGIFITESDDSYTDRVAEGEVRIISQEQLEEMIAALEKEHA